MNPKHHFFKVFQVLLDDEGWSLNAKVFNKKNIFNPKSPWISNTAVAQLLFKDKEKFNQHFPRLRIVENRVSEFLIFLNSGGVNSNFFILNSTIFFKIFEFNRQIFNLFIPWGFRTQ